MAPAVPGTGPTVHTLGAQREASARLLPTLLPPALDLYRLPVRSPVPGGGRVLVGPTLSRCRVRLVPGGFSHVGVGAF